MVLCLFLFFSHSPLFTGTGYFRKMPLYTETTRREKDEV